MSEEEIPAYLPVERRLVLGVLVSGRGSNLQAIFNAIEGGRLDAQVAVVISNRKEVPALARARACQTPSFFLDPAEYTDRADYDGALVQLLKMYAVELVVLAGYMRLVTPVFIDAYRDRIINIHPSLLPAFPGLHAQSQALEYGAKVAGCTVHFVDEKVDHGPIIAQASVPIFEGDDERHLSERILVEEHRLLPHVLQRYAEGRVGIQGRKVSMR